VVAHVIHKHPITFRENLVNLPIGSVVLRAGLRPADGDPSIWFRAPVGESRMETRRFFVVGTGHAFEANAVYVGTFETGELVWHVFEAVKS